MKIGELARLQGCTPETIRFYEKVGLLPAPVRTEGNYRHYDNEHVQRLRFIRNCRILDMSHDEIRSLLQAHDETPDDCQPVNQSIDAHIEHVETRIRELSQLKEQLALLRQRCTVPHDVKSCGIFVELQTAEMVDPHVHGHTHL
ncbi:Cd(II)/Pb(II)-responsive transcriptional regulator [Advenella sp. S44]|uniref:Cd(II)/Pb(II)-responsive transcriptional regulator n=1 Tax=Advenella sp. S44 TaxID=1982755 RepID=UPI000C2AFA43|nr:Cd(II)/Pb(II)-responsive transcriptional regulator [Advenella sp. S44]PJX26061.1 Cd(II)/Pb(II)-responsive transcriptional regulator [Advenella sp. S44]